MEVLLFPLFFCSCLRNWILRLVLGGGGTRKIVLGLNIECPAMVSDIYKRPLFHVLVVH